MAIQRTCQRSITFHTYKYSRSTNDRKLIFAF